MKMKRLRKAILVMTIVSLIGALPVFTTAFAATIGDCVLTGYTGMAGWFYQSSTPDGSSSQKDYFLAQPLYYPFQYDYQTTVDMWGFAWLKFDVGTETVESAYLALDLLGVGGMVLEDASEDYPATLDIYSAGDVDVASISNAEDDDAALVIAEALKNTLYSSGESLTGTITMSSNGTYYLDITEIYNAWVTGSIANNGLVLVSYSENNSGASAGVVGARFASFGSTEGSAPYITDSAAVPVPGAILLLGSGLVGLTGLRRRNS